MTRVQTLIIEEDDADVRLDRWLRRRFPYIGQGRIEKLCRKGEIRLDGGRVKSSTRLQCGQKLRLPPLPESEDMRPRDNKPELYSEADAEMIRACVIYRDDYIIALNKPPGLAVQGGSGQSRHVDGLAKALVSDRDERPRLVHRLDKDTSGILLLARSVKVAASLTKAFRARTTRKIYWAAVAGCPSPEMGTIQFGLLKSAGHGPNGAGEKMVCIHPDDVRQTPDAKHATTNYAVLEKLGQRTSWVALVPVTGRTHQLRAHMAEIGNPVVGDGKYGTNRQTNEGDGWGAQLGGDVSRKLHLHARSLSFTHPVTGAELKLVAPLPDHMKKTWEMFCWETKWAPDDPFQDQS